MNQNYLRIILQQFDREQASSPFLLTNWNIPTK